MKKLRMVSVGAVARPPHYSRLARLALVTALLVPAWRVSAQAEPGFNERVEAHVFSLVNDLRSERGLKPLERERRLDAAAEYFGGYMAAAGRMDHDADGGSPTSRAKKRGYAYCVISENIAYEYSSRGFTAERLARALVDGWRDSPTHRDNILDPEVTQTGLGIARSDKGEYYAAQLFARPMLTGVKKGAACRRPG